ncbi:MAG: diguanylate cyclase [Lachnospiraceae bacterium]|nr:diguanylate cyclase [Lachnospiraceae bacterium]
MKRRGFFSIFVGLLLLVTLLSPLQVCASSRTLTSPYRILVICSYNYSFVTVPQHINGFIEGLGDVNYEITYENMDAKTYYRSVDIAQFYHYLSYKMGQVPPYDLVILMDDTALHFGVNYRNVLFSGTPMIFLGINSISDATTAAALNDVTGIAEVLDYESNYKLMQDIFPERDHIVILSDASNTCTGEYIEFMKFAANHPDLNYTVVNTSYYSTEGFARTLEELSDNSVIFCLDFSTDGSDKIYTQQGAAAFIGEHAPSIPVFNPSAANFYGNFVGGYSYSYVDAGKKAGEMARGILNGTDPDDYPFVTSAVSKLSIEQGAMDTFGIKYSALPDDVTIVNERPSLATFYRGHTLISNLLLLIFLLLLTIIVILIGFNIRRHQIINQDFLTKVPNRSFLNNRIHAAKDTQTTYGIIMVDLDNFKTINDTLGHTIGDELLLAFATRLKALTDKDVIFGRIGGDEFMGFMPNPTYEKADIICQKIVQTMSAPFHLSTGSIEITASIGCAMYPQDTDNVMLVTRLADQALYEVKATGKNDYRLFRDTLKAKRS